ncbi:MAG: hypothetical protein ACI3ZE_01795, partial [Candidatus Woodwardiibium sp.]
PFRGLFEKSPLKTFKNFWERSKPLLFCLKTRVDMQTKAAPFLTAPLFVFVLILFRQAKAQTAVLPPFPPDRSSEGCRTAGRGTAASAVISACF